MHWADDGSVELLGALLRRPPAAAVLIALAVRPRQLPERLSGALERADRAGMLVRGPLEELTEAEAGELLGVSGTKAAALYEAAGGNPFYLQQLARAGGRTVGGDGAGTPLTGADVPRAVAAALAEELASFAMRLAGTPSAEIAATLRITRSELSERTAAIVTRLAHPEPPPEPRRRGGVPRGLGALRAA